MFNHLEPLFLEDHSVRPEYEWVTRNEGFAAVWWDTATLQFINGDPVLHGRFSEDIKATILAEISELEITDGYYFICGPGINENLYRFNKIIFIPLGDNTIAFKQKRTWDNIQTFLQLQHYRGIVFINPDLSEHNACFVIHKSLTYDT